MLLEENPPHSFILKLYTSIDFGFDKHNFSSENAQNCNF